MLLLIILDFWASMLPFRQASSPSISRPSPASVSRATMLLR